MRVPPMEKTTYASFKEYDEVPKTVPLQFRINGVMWVASKLSGAAGALGAEVIELQNWLIFFGCASKELRVIVARLADWMAKPPPPRDAYCALMACHLVALDKRPGVRHVGKGEKLRRDLAKLVMRAAGSKRRQCVETFSCVQVSRQA